MTILENSCWPRRTTCEKILIILNIVIFIIAIIIGISFHIYIKTKDDVCYTPECTLASARILKTVNWTIDPCDDFYEMVCGARPKEKTIVVSTPSDYFERNLFFNRLLLKAYEEDNLGNKLFELPKKFFKVCRNEDQRKNAHLSNEITPIIKNVTEASEEDFQWLKALISARKSGFPFNQFISINIRTNIHDGNKPIVVIGYPEHPDFSIKDEKLSTDSEIVKALSSLFKRFRLTYDLSDIHKALEVEQRLIKERKPSKFKEMKSYTTSQMDEEFKMNEKWEKIIGVHINEPIIYVTDEKFLKNIQKMLDESDKKHLKIYMELQLVRFANSFDDHTGKTNLLDECIKSTYSRFPIISSAMYFKKLSSNDKTLIKQHVNALKSVLDRVIRAVTWMDDETQSKAHKKWRRMKTTLGLTSKLRKELEDFYSELAIKDDSYAKNFLRVNEFMVKYWLKVLESGGARQLSVITPLYNIEEAGYLQKSNEFVIGARFLQDVHFDKNRPQYMNFGAFGARTSQFLVHGFDNIGRHYDFQGKLDNWWDTFTENKYDDKASCIEKQYNHFKDPKSDLNIDGYFTKDKNLADTSGVDIAYFSYIGWTRMYGNSKRLPGMPNSNDKLFWFSYASSFCQKFEYDPSEYLFSTQNFAPPKLRVNGALQNSKNFQNDFECKKGTKMHKSDGVCQLYTVEPWFFYDDS